MTGFVKIRGVDVINWRARLSETKTISAFVQCFLASLPLVDVMGQAIPRTGHVSS